METLANYTPGNKIIVSRNVINHSMREKCF